MMRAITGILLVALVFGSGLRRAEAQVFTPTFMAPASASDLGLYLSDGPGEFSVEGIWRQPIGGFDLGLRLGLADTDDVSILVGGELRNPLAVAAPLDLAVTAGAQGQFGDDRSAVGFQGGLSVGHTFAAEGIAITPYLHPRVALVKPRRRADFDLELLADFGFDIRFSPTLELRFGVAMHDIGANWGVGFAWR